MASVEEWSVERHLADEPTAVAALYGRFVRLLKACGPYMASVTETAIALMGTHGGLAGAKPRKALSTGCSIYEKCGTKGSFGHPPYEEPRRPSISDTNMAQLHDSFAALMEDAYQVGRCAHRVPRKTS